MNSDQSARLERVARQSTLRLTHYGRKSGKPYEVTIWFVADVDNDKIYLSTANVGRQWVRNVQKTPRVKLNVHHELFEGEARFLSDPADHKHVMRMVRQKYWLFRPPMALWEWLQKLGIAQDNTGSFEVTLS